MGDKGVPKDLLSITSPVSFTDRYTGETGGSKPVGSDQLLGNNYGDLFQRVKLTEYNLKKVLEDSNLRTKEKIESCVSEITGKKPVLSHSTDEKYVEMKDYLKKNNKDILETVYAQLSDELKARQIKLL